LRPGDIENFDGRMETLRREGSFTGEVTRCRKDGKALSLWLTATCVPDIHGKLSHYIRVFTDISLLKETQHKLERLASFDTLTGLPNRRLFQDRLEQALLGAERHRTTMGLMFVDLDGFKEVNDTLGHDVGDLLLREAALRLEQCVRANDTVGRFGGDEFAVILQDTSLPMDAEVIGNRIVMALAEPFDLDGHRLRISASLGIARYPTDGTDATALLKSADVAMYTAKRLGRNRLAFYHHEIQPTPANL
jgi:diguanylate cyclase (GGDEF)-like protein